MSLAKVILSGVVETDPEQRFTPQNAAVSTFTMWVPAPAKQGQQAPQSEQSTPDGFVLKVTCWRQLAEVVTETLRKGDSVIVEGKLMTNSFQSPEGVAKKGFEIELHSVDKLSAPPQSISAPPASQGTSQSGGSRGGNSSYGGGNNQSAPPMDYGNTGGGGNQQSSSYSQAPVGVATATANSGFSGEDLMNTEDDIPF